MSALLVELVKQNKVAIQKVLVDTAPEGITEAALAVCGKTCWFFGIGDSIAQY